MSACGGVDHSSRVSFKYDARRLGKIETSMILERYAMTLDKERAWKSFVWSCFRCSTCIGLRFFCSFLVDLFGARSLTGRIWDMGTGFRYIKIRMLILYTFQNGFPESSSRTIYLVWQWVRPRYR